MVTDKMATGNMAPKGGYLGHLANNMATVWFKNIHLEAIQAYRLAMAFIIPVFIIVSVLLAAPQIGIGLVIVLVGAGIPMLVSRLLSRSS